MPTLDDDIRDVDRLIAALEAKRQQANLARYSRMLGSLYRRRDALKLRREAAREAAGDAKAI